MESAKKGALKQFEIENNIVTEDALFEFNDDEYQLMLRDRPWNKEYVSGKFSVVSHPYSEQTLLFQKSEDFCNRSHQDGCSY